MLVKLTHAQGNVLRNLAESTGYSTDDLARHLVETSLTVLLALPWPDRRAAVLDNLQMNNKALIDVLNQSWRNRVWDVTPGGPV